jgi:DNA replication protein DnaC
LAGFATRKRLDEFDFALPPSTNRKQVVKLDSCAFVERAENVVLLRPPGVSKSHLAIALEVTRRRYSVEFTSAARLVASLAKSRGAGSFSRRLSSFCRPRLPIVDEIGLLPLDTKGSALLFEVVARRHHARGVNFQSWWIRGIVATLSRFVTLSHPRGSVPGCAAPAVCAADG